MLSSGCFYLVQAGNALAAVHECENLKKEGTFFNLTLKMLRALFYAED